MTNQGTLTVTGKIILRAKENLKVTKITFNNTEDDYQISLLRYKHLTGFDVVKVYEYDLLEGDTVIDTSEYLLGAKDYLLVKSSPTTTYTIDWVPINPFEQHLTSSGSVKIIDKNGKERVTGSADSETDPIWLADKPNYLTTAIAASTYVPKTRTLTINGQTFDLGSNRTWTIPTTVDWGDIGGTITDQTDLITYLDANYYSVTNPDGYITTETDPVFTASDAFGISAADISNWDTAFGWGNHASAGYLTSATAASTYVPYTGATTNVNLGSNNLTALGLFLTNGVNFSAGPTIYSAGAGTINFGSNLFVHDFSAVTGTLKTMTWVNRSGTVLVNASGDLASGMGAFLNNPTSANLRTTVTDETGTGSLVFATSPTIVTPTIAKLANLTTNGFVKTSGGDGTLSVDTTTYATDSLVVHLAGTETITGAKTFTTNNVTFGSSIYDMSNTRWGINTTPSARLHILQTAIGVTLSDAHGILEENTTAATLGNQQWSPPIVLAGKGFATTSSTSMDARLRISNAIQQNTGTPLSKFYVERNANAGAYSELFAVYQNPGSNDIVMSFGGSIAFGQGSGVTQYYGSSSGFAFYNSAGSIQFVSINGSGAWALTPSSFTTAATLNAFNITQTWNNASGVYTGIRYALTNTASAATSRVLDLVVGGSSVFNVATGGALVTAGAITATGSGITGFNYTSTGGSNSAVSLFNATNSLGTTAGTSSGINFSGMSFAPTSGTGVFNTLNISPTINQTGVTGTPITRGVYINPTLTSALDWRSLEITRGNIVLGALDMVLDTTTGTKIGTATSQKIGLWNATPIVQPTTGVASSTRVGGAGTTVTDTDTFDGYTLAQVVKALRNIGILA